MICFLRRNLANFQQGCLNVVRTFSKSMIAEWKRIFGSTSSKARASHRLVGFSPWQAKIGQNFGLFCSTFRRNYFNDSLFTLKNIFLQIALLRSNECSSGDAIFLVTCTNMSSISWYSFLAQDMLHFHKSSNKVFVLGKKYDFQKRSKFPHFVKLRPNDKTTIIHFDLSLLHVYGHPNNIYREKCYFCRHSISYNEALPPP